MLFNCHCLPQFAPLHICSMCGLNTLSSFCLSKMGEQFLSWAPRWRVNSSNHVSKEQLKQNKVFLKLNKQRVGGRKLTVTDVLHLPELKLAGILFNCELLMCCLKQPAVARANGPREKTFKSKSRWACRECENTTTVLTVTGLTDLRAFWL